MPRKGENIYKRKDGHWEGRYIYRYDEFNKGKYAYIYGKSYSEVKKKLSERKAMPIESFETFPKPAVMYEQILDEWLCAVRLNVKESTYARYDHLIKTHIEPHLGKCRLSHLGATLIEEYILMQLSNGRLDGKGALSPKTVTDILTIIKSTFEYAEYKGYTIPCNISKLNIKKREKEMRVLSYEEQECLVRVLTQNMDRCKFGTLLSLYTGIRIGELCALKWEDVNLAQSTLVIRKTMQRIQNHDENSNHKTKIIITEPKSKCSVRKIPLPKFIVEYAIQFISEPNDYILSGKPDKFIEPRTMQNRFKSYVTESGIESANFHSLRHTFATRCVEVGFEIKSLSEILGHANVNITLNRYVHSSFELKCSNMNKLALNI